MCIHVWLCILVIVCVKMVVLTVMETCSLQASCEGHFLSYNAWNHRREFVPGSLSWELGQDPRPDSLNLSFCGAHRTCERSKSVHPVDCGGGGTAGLGDTAVTKTVTSLLGSFIPSQRGQKVIPKAKHRPELKHKSN